MSIQAANALIAILENEQQHGAPDRRRILNAERCNLITARDSRIRTVEWERALAEVDGRSLQAEAQYEALEKQIRDRGCSGSALSAQIQEAQRVLDMWPPTGARAVSRVAEKLGDHD